MAYSISEHNAIQVVEVKDLLNEFDNKTILSDVQSRIENGYNRFVVDLTKLDFMNSVGLNFLISVLTKSRKSGGDLALVNANDQVVKLLEITKLKTLFNLSNSVEDAVQTFDDI